jgi:DNA polymerase-3 subunit beta
MASDKTWGIRIALDKGFLSIEADNPDLGNAREKIEVDYKGGALSVGFNARYFIELLTEIGSPEVKLELAGELDPAVVRPGDGSDYLGVVMPMRL